MSTKARVEEYEVSGETGKNVVWTMGKVDRRTAVVKRKLIGGSCPNVACLPSKRASTSCSPRFRFDSGHSLRSLGNEDTRGKLPHEVGSFCRSGGEKYGWSSN